MESGLEVTENLRKIVDHFTRWGNLRCLQINADTSLCHIILEYLKHCSFLIKFLNNHSVLFIGLIQNFLIVCWISVNKKFTSINSTGKYSKTELSLLRIHLLGCHATLPRKEGVHQVYISGESSVTSRKTDVEETTKFCENTETAINLNGTKHGFV